MDSVDDARPPSEAFTVRWHPKHCRDLLVFSSPSLVLQERRRVLPRPTRRGAWSSWILSTTATAAVPPGGRVATKVDLRKHSRKRKIESCHEISHSLLPLSRLAGAPARAAAARPARRGEPTDTIDDGDGGGAHWRARGDHDRPKTSGCAGELREALAAPVSACYRHPARADIPRRSIAHPRHLRGSVGRLCGGSAVCDRGARVFYHLKKNRKRTSR